MSYEHGTTHYNLPLTEGSDKRDWFDTNQAFEDVDAALFAASEAAGSASADVEQIKTDVTALQGRMTTAETDIDNVEASQATQAEQIINLTNRVNSVVVQTENKFNSVAVADAYDPSSTYSVDDYCVYDGNLYQCITAITTGEPFDADKWIAIDLINLIGGGGATPTAADVSLAPITGMTATNVQSGLAEHQGDITQINNDLADKADVISTGWTKVGTVTASTNATWSNTYTAASNYKEVRVEIKGDGHDGHFQAIYQHTRGSSIKNVPLGAALDIIDLGDVSFTIDYLDVMSLNSGDELKFYIDHSMSTSCTMDIYAR